jgi:hypothetical protein
MGAALAATHSLRECGRAMVRWRRQFADLGYPVTKMLAPMLAQAVDWSDFGPSGNGDGTVPAAAHSLRACEGAMARRRGLFAAAGYPVTKMLEHMLARKVDATDF